MSSTKDFNRLIERVEQLRVSEFPISEPVDFTPVWSSVSNPQPSIGDGELIGRYYLRGPMCLLQFQLTGGAGTSWGTGNWSFSLPVAHAATGMLAVGPAHIRDAGANNYDRLALIASGASVLTTFTQLDGGTNVNNISSSVPMTWTTGDTLTVQIEYPIR